jgi:hypothetical protein
MTECPVVLVLRDVEVDVAVERISVPLVDQTADDIEHLGDVLGRVRKQIDRIDPHRLQVVEVVLRHFAGQLLDRRLPLSRAHDQLVIHVGDVDHKFDGIPQVSEISLDGVEDHRPDHVTDVRRLVDCRPAQIHPDFSRHDSLEVFLRTRQRVVNSKRHEKYFGSRISELRSKPTGGVPWVRAAIRHSLSPAAPPLPPPSPPPGQSAQPAPPSWPSR